MKKKVLAVVLTAVLTLSLGLVMAGPVGAQDEECWETRWQIGDEETLGCNGNTWRTNYADEFNWASPAGPCTQGPTLTQNVPTFTDPFIVLSTPISEFPYNSNYVRGYATDFDVQWTGSLPLGGRLTISWSPGSSGAERKVVSGDGITSTPLTAVGASEPGEGWFRDTYPLVEQTVDVATLPDGTHTIRFQHTQGDGTFWDWIKLEALIPCNQPPDCSEAYADPGCLWPPNHKFVDISIIGVTDPDGDPVTITITSITSDEPTATDNGSGGAKHAPDATGVGTDTASVRAERSGNHDGRVYVINFTADDGQGGTCEGSVAVKVPHDQSGEDCPAVDSGRNYDATQIN